MVKVSVIMPVYNVERYLGEALESAMTQSLQEIEIIAVDDGSTDNSGIILEEYAQKDSRIKVIHKANTGYGHTMNVGIDAAQGEYIAVLESDDKMLPDMLQNLYMVAGTLGAEIVRGDWIRFYEQDGEIVEEVKNSCHKGMYYKVWNPKDMEPALFGCCMMSWSGIVCKDLLDKYHIRHNETPGASYQDNGFWFRMLCHAEKIVYIDQPGYLYRGDNPNSSVRQTENLFAMNEEYSYIYSYVKTRPELQGFLPVFWMLKYRNCLFTLRRIRAEYRKLYAKHMKEEFVAAKNKGELDKRFFPKKHWKEVQHLLSDADAYMEYIGI